MMNPSIRIPQSERFEKLRPYVLTGQHSLRHAWSAQVPVQIHGTYAPMVDCFEIDRSEKMLKQQREYVQRFEQCRRMPYLEELEAMSVGTENPTVAFKLPDSHPPMISQKWLTEDNSRNTEEAGIGSAMV